MVEIMDYLEIMEPASNLKTILRCEPWRPMARGWKFWLNLELQQGGDNGDIWYIGTWNNLTTSFLAMRWDRG